MSKRHTIYALFDETGRFVTAYLSFSEAMREKRTGWAIISILDREDY